MGLLGLGGRGLVGGGGGGRLAAEVRRDAQVEGGVRLDAVELGHLDWAIDVAGVWVGLVGCVVRLPYD